MTKRETPDSEDVTSPLGRVAGFCLDNRLLVVLTVVVLVVWGYIHAPFDWSDTLLPRDPVPVDAIPDIGENQQIIFTEWPGRSPQDVEDQITYPLSTFLMGIRGVRTIRSTSMFGFSSVYLIFKEAVDFELSRQRILEKLASLSPGLLPEDVQPQLGPDATALGQIFWYTLEGRDREGRPAPGWSLHERRSVQDFFVRYGLLAAEGVSEVASVGGFVREYQINVDPDALRAWGISLQDVFQAVRQSNLDVGARTIEMNQVEYVVRGVGLVKSLEDLRKVVLDVRDGAPVMLEQVAQMQYGPAPRRGALDKEGAEVVGGVVVVRYGENPLTTIQNVKDRIARISRGLPKKTLPDGTVSQLTIVPFYDRTGLIHETLGTLKTALYQQIIITSIVVLIMLLHFRSSILISGLLPLAVLMSFIAMKLAGVDANIVALSGIAIAIGTMVDMGIVLGENILREMNDAHPGESTRAVVRRATSSVAGAVITSSATTIISFLPVFTMQAAEGKLFRPLAFTKTFALLASVVVAVIFLPPLAHWLFTLPGPWKKRSRLFRWGNRGLIALFTLLLTLYWRPLGPETGVLVNLLFVGLCLLVVLGGFRLFIHFYPVLLARCLRRKKTFLILPAAILALGMCAWLGFGRLSVWLPEPLRLSKPVVYLRHLFPGLGREFMPALDEGAFLYMPTTMPHAALSEVRDMLARQDRRILAIPEVREVVGKLGRAETPLDPAPVSMIETVIQYYPQYLTDAEGRVLRFAFDAEQRDFFRDPGGESIPAADGKPYQVQGRYQRDEAGRLVPARLGRPFRLWRPALDPALNPGRAAWPGIESPQDIWNVIEKQARMPGMTSAPKLQPIETRIVMLQSGMRAPMGIKVQGPNLATIEAFSLRLEEVLRQAPFVRPDTVNAERIVGKPYLEIRVDRDAIARFAIPMERIQRVVEVAIGGKVLSSTIEGRERYSIRVRYPRELRNSPEKIRGVLVAAADGTLVPLEQLASIDYVRGPQMIRNEDTFLTNYVLFDRQPDRAEVEVVEQARALIESRIADGSLEVPAGVQYHFAGSFENQIRAARRLRVVLPLSLFLIFLILYLKFRSSAISLIVFSGVAVAWAGGFVLIWLYGQPWFLNFSLVGVPLRELFQIDTIHLSVAIWVGFLALFGIATDDGVLMATYIQRRLREAASSDAESIRSKVLEAGIQRVRPCMMTTATTLLALLPVLTSRGRGSDILVPMAIPLFGGMFIQVCTTLVTPVLYCWKEEWLQRRR